MQTLTNLGHFMEKWKMSLRLSKDGILAVQLCFRKRHGALIGS